MPQDDVTSTTPLRGGRQKANHIQVMRLEMGLAERKAILVPVASILQEVQASAQTFKVIRTGAIAAAGVASLGAVYVGWRIGKAMFDFVEDAEDLANGAKKVFKVMLPPPIKGAISVWDYLTGEPDKESWQGGGGGDF